MHSSIEVCRSRKVKLNMYKVQERVEPNIAGTWNVFQIYSVFNKECMSSEHWAKLILYLINRIGVCEPAAEK